LETAAVGATGVVEIEGCGADGTGVVDTFRVSYSKDLLQCGQPFCK